MDTDGWQGQKLSPPKVGVPFLPHRLMDPTTVLRTFVNELGFFLVARPSGPQLSVIQCPSLCNSYSNLIFIVSPLPSESGCDVIAVTLSLE